MNPNEEGPVEIGDKFEDYQEIIENIRDFSSFGNYHSPWRFMNISMIGNKISKFYFINDFGDLILWVKPCDEGWVITKKVIRQFDNTLSKSVAIFG